MPYTHFGKPADVWKHLALCEILNFEKPKTYIETNSAYADYLLDNSPERKLGIFHFIEKTTNNLVLSKSIYYRQEKPALIRQKYLGSPGLAINILSELCNTFIFFDIEKNALKNIDELAKSLHIQNKINLNNRDSLSGIDEWLPQTSSTSFIHIDPYEIDRDGISGKTYLDIFIEAAKRKAKCLLWYGFNTLNEKQRLNKYILSGLSGLSGCHLHCIELIMKNIGKDTPTCNPGISGSGLLSCNLSENSLSAIDSYSMQMVDIYENSRYKGNRADIYMEKIID